MPSLPQRCETCGRPLPPRGGRTGPAQVRCDQLCTEIASVLGKLERLLSEARQRVEPDRRRGIRATLWRTACALNAHEARSGRYRGVASERALQERARRPDA